jgi:NADP-dependent 3-hydroxy acid dehydrogenase YdfG
MQASGGDEVVVVTGASAGVRRATARWFGKRDAKVTLLARGSEGLATTKREIEVAGGRALPIPTEVSDANAVEEAARRTEEEIGPIDVRVNNAMTSVFSPVREMTPEECLPERRNGREAAQDIRTTQCLRRGPHRRRPQS